MFSTGSFHIWTACSPRGSSDNKIRIELTGLFYSATQEVVIQICYTFQQIPRSIYSVYNTDIAGLRFADGHNEFFKIKLHVSHHHAPVHI